MNDEWLFVNNRDEAQNILRVKLPQIFLCLLSETIWYFTIKEVNLKEMKETSVWQFSISFEGMIYMCGSMQQYMTVCFIVIEICLQK